MEAAEIVERAGTGERKGIRVVSVERLRPKGLILVDYIVRNVVLIDPFHRRSNGDGQLRRGEGEVVDRLCPRQHTRRPVRYGAYVTDLLQLADNWPLQRFAIIGHSMGGTNAINFAGALSRTGLSAPKPAQRTYQYRS